MLLPLATGCGGAQRGKRGKDFYERFHQRSVVSQFLSALWRVSLRDPLKRVFFFNKESLIDLLSLKIKISYENYFKVLKRAQTGGEIKLQIIETITFCKQVCCGLLKMKFHKKIKQFNQFYTILMKFAQNLYSPPKLQIKRKLKATTKKKLHYPDRCRSAQQPPGQ